MFADLVGQDRVKLAELFTTYAANDAAAAFQLAEACAVDLATEQPYLVLRSCSDPPFLGIAVRQALQSVENTRRWAPVLAEAGLREPAAASVLNAQVVADQNMEDARIKTLGFERSSDWTGVAGLTEYARRRGQKFDRAAPMTCYGLVLSLATSRMEGEVQFPCLNVLKRLRAPKSILPRWIKAVAAAPLTLVVLAGVAGVVYLIASYDPTAAQQPARSSDSVSFWLALLAVGILAVTFVILALPIVIPLLYPPQRLFVYTVLLNLDAAANTAMRSKRARPLNLLRRIFFPRVFRASREMLAERARELPADIPAAEVTAPEVTA
jgi:hypothetical protein